MGISLGRGPTYEAEEGRPFRLVVADDHPVFREALVRIVDGQPDLQVVGEAEDGQRALELCRRLEPELALFDIRMPKMDGIEATRKLKRERPSLIVLMVTALEDPKHLLEALKAGASGYVLKYADAKEITDAIRKALIGEPSLDQGVAMRLFTRLIAEKREEEERPGDPAYFKRPSEEPSKTPAVNPLTPREMELLGLMARGQTNRQIAQNLSISVGTVKSHVHHILSKLGASDRVQAVVMAVEVHGLLNS